MSAQPICTDDRDTYVVDSITGCAGTITDALTGITYAQLASGVKIALGVPLCSGCDVIADERPCDCQLAAPAAVEM